LIALYINLSLSIDFVNINFLISIDFFNISLYISDIMNVNGLTIREMAEELGLGQPAVKMRLRVAGVKPIGYAGPAAVYDTSALETIRNVPGKGRPPKAKPEKS
jgi:hypothetical protein